MKKYLGLTLIILIFSGCTVELNNEDFKADIKKGMNIMYSGGYKQAIDCVKKHNIHYCENTLYPKIMKFLERD